ncbi:hypothetical protein GCM10009416_15670 [Craurococcus roseus]|uniref:Uncharacterized protein n=1 Tax=Craurococcus roseus TaxID=77585 RepID=A0ABP3PXA7_9PROT
MLNARRIALAAAGACLAAGAAWTPSVASAGPCSNDIAELARTLSASPALGGTPTTGTLSGAGPNNAPAAGGGAAAATSPDRTAGTSGSGRQGGTAGTRELNAAVGNQVATSPEDVRRQQQGQPTTAAQAEAGQRAQSDRERVEVVPGAPGGPSAGGGDRMERAKAELETARTLDQRDDGSCRDAINRVRQAMQGS